MKHTQLLITAVPNSPTPWRT